MCTILSKSKNLGMEGFHTNFRKTVLMDLFRDDGVCKTLDTAGLLIICYKGE